MAVRFISSLLHAAKNIETAIITCPIDHDDDDGDGPGRLLLEVPFQKTLKMLLSKKTIFATSMLGCFFLEIYAEQESYAQSCDLFTVIFYGLYHGKSPFGRICWGTFFPSKHPGPSSKSKKEAAVFSKQKNLTVSTSSGHPYLDVLGS